MKHKSLIENRYDVGEQSACIASDLDPRKKMATEKYFSSIMNKGGNSKPSEHFDSHQRILGAGHRDFLECSPTGSKSVSNLERRDNISFLSAFVVSYVSELTFG